MSITKECSTLIKVIDMKITSTAFKEGEKIPPKYTADGEDISPPLKWEGEPKDTKSFALICDDPDAPVGTWVHWLVCDIPPTVHEALEGKPPKGGKLVKNMFDQLEYGGPSPPKGTHRYFFKLYALKAQVLPNINDKNFYKLVLANKIDEAQLMGKYQRPGR
jgi:Raf kinase inhibitor-like YbhB/YbcL family protein